MPIVTVPHHVANADGSESFLPAGTVVDEVHEGREAFYGGKPAQTTPEVTEEPARPPAQATPKK